MSAFTEGDVVHYIPENGWCREGTATVDEQGLLRDTYWHSGNHALSDIEVATAQPSFNLGEFREIGKYECWEDYHPDHRREITRQHGLVRLKFVRKGALPDLDTRIENAREAVRQAERGVKDAEWRLDLCRKDLARIEAERVES